MPICCFLGFGTFQALVGSPQSSPSRRLSFEPLRCALAAFSHARRRASGRGSLSFCVLAISCSTSPISRAAPNSCLAAFVAFTPTFPFCGFASVCRESRWREFRRNVGVFHPARWFVRWQLWARSQTRIGGSRESPHPFNSGHTPRN